MQTTVPVDVVLVADENDDSGESTVGVFSGKGEANGEKKENDKFCDISYIKYFSQIQSCVSRLYLNCKWNEYGWKWWQMDFHESWTLVFFISDSIFAIFNSLNDDQL